MASTIGPGGMVDLWKHTIGMIDMVLGPTTGETIAGNLPNWSFDRVVIGDVPEPIDPPDLPWERCAVPMSMSAMGRATR